MTVQGLFLLLLVAKSMAHWDLNTGIRSWKSLAQARAVPTQCTQAGNFCSNCQESYFCQTATSTPLVFTCPSNHICDGAVGACLDYTADASAGDCDCDTVGNTGYLADPYDNTRFFICLQTGQQFLASCADGQIFSSETDTCVDVIVGPSGNDSNVDCSVEGFGLHTNDPTCQTYNLCFSTTPLPGILYSCPEGQAFDNSIPGCVSQCSLGPSVFACPADGSGAFPDTSDCTIFHVCSGADLIQGSPVSCPDGQLFDPTTMLCVPPTTNVICPIINECWSAYCDTCGGTCPGTIVPNPDDTLTTPSSGGGGGSSSSTDPPNCNNSKGYYAYGADCKQFWSCQDNDAGGFEPILYRCPGILYFNPSTSYCQTDLPANSACIVVT